MRPSLPALTPRSPRPWSEIACEVACLAFAFWTVLCNVTVWSGGSLRQLVVAAAVAVPVLAAGLGAGALVLRRRAGGPAEIGAAEGGETAADAPIPPALRGAAALLALLAVLAYPLFSRIVIFWWLGAGVLALGVVSLLFDRRSHAIPAPRSSRRWEAALWALALGAVLFNLTVHRPDPDDSLYINIAADAADHPDDRLMAEDRMHGIEGFSFHSPVYLSNSIEPLWAAASWLTGIPALLWFHVVHAALGALLIVLAYGVLFRLLVPERWLPAVGILLVVLIFGGGPENHWYGNLAFVRVWQGKCTFLHVYLPLTFAYAMRFGQRPTPYGWILLASAQVAALGMSSSSIWVEPLAAGLGLLCGSMGAGLRGLLRVVVGCLGSAYTLGFGFYLKGLVRDNSEKILREGFKLRDYKSSLGFQEPLEQTGQALDWGLKNVMGESPLLYLGLAALLAGWIVSRQALTRRFAVLVPALGLFFILNPFLERFVMANVVGPVYYRATWLLPIPVLITLLFLAPLDLDSRRVSRRMVMALVGIALLGYGARASEFPTFDRRNRVYYGPPGVKIAPDVRPVLEQGMELLPAGAYVIAPVQPSFWFPTFHHPLYPVVVNRWYTFIRGRDIPREEVNWRIALTDYVSGEARPEDFPGRFREGLSRFGIQGVVLDLHATWREEIEQALTESRFRSVEPAPQDGEPRYQLWLRPPDDPDVVNAPKWKTIALRP